MSDPPKLDGVRHEYLDAGGLRVHVALAGDENAPPIVLVHGWPQNWWTWREVIPALAENHRVIAIDLRGHGWSEVTRAGYEKEQLASDLLGVLDRLKVDRVTYVGHDWGGFVGFLVALRAPERLDRMLTLAIPHLWVPRHPRQLALLGYQGPLSTPFLGPRVAERMVRYILQVGRGPDRLSAEDLEVFARHLPAEVSVAMYRTFLTRELLPIARGRYAGIDLKTPTTLMIGARDAVTRGIPAGPVAQQPRLEVEVLDEVAHWIPEQRPQAILDWVAR